MRISLATLTPIWTGNVDRDSPTLRETGIIGSLRWWYEGLHRGLGHYVCEPVEGKGCQFDAEAYKQAKNRGVEAAVEAGLRDVCPVCRLFGCTGWARRFRVSATGMQTLPLFFVSNRRMASLTGNWFIRIYDGKKHVQTDSQGHKHTSFSFNNTTLWSEGFDLVFTPVHTYWSEDSPRLLAYLLSLVATYGALGAKVQNGFGQVKIKPDSWDGWPHNAVERGRELARSNGSSAQYDGSSFNLARFFSYTYELSTIRPYDQEFRMIGQAPSDSRYSHRFIPCAFDIRYKSSSRNPFTGQGENFGMRPFFRDRFGQRVTNTLLGESQPRRDDDRAASRINVSHLYCDDGQWKLKVWGHIPPDLEDLHYRPVDVADIERAVNDFIAGPRGMFPDSRVVRSFNRREELGR
jgi:CRISPR-associated protein Cmr1